MRKSKNLHKCLVCDNEFVAPTKKDGRRKLFCSPDCRAIGKGIAKVCKYCDLPFKSYEDRKYCCLECYYADNGAEMVDLTCKECGISFQRKAHQVFRSDGDPFSKKFCSPACFVKGTSGKKNSRYLGNRAADRGPSWKKQRKKSLKESNGICYFCGSGAKGKNACVDHIIPFRLFSPLSDEGLSANELVNLWVLCRSCHAKKTQMEIGVLYSVGFEEFVARVSTLSDRNVSVRMKEAKNHWLQSLATETELEVLKAA